MRAFCPNLHTLIIPAAAAAALLAGGWWVIISEKYSEKSLLERGECNTDSSGVQQIAVG